MRRTIWLLTLLTTFISCRKDFKPLQEGSYAYVVNGGDKSVDVINLTSQTLDRSFKLGVGDNFFPHHVYASPSREKLVVATPTYDFSKGHDMTHSMQMPGGIKVISSSTGIELLSIDLETLNHNAVFSPNGKEIWTAKMSHSGKVLVFDAETGVELNAIQVDSDPSEVIFTKDGEYALVACGESTFLNVIEVASKEVIKQIKVDNYPANVWEGYGSISLVSNMMRKSVNFVDTDDMKVVDFIDLPFMPGYVDYNEFTEELWICNSMMSKVMIYKKEGEKWQMSGSIDSEGDPHMLKFYDNEKGAILINQKANTLKFIDTQSKEVIKEIGINAKPNGIVVIER